MYRTHFSGFCVLLFLNTFCCSSCQSSNQKVTNDINKNDSLKTIIKSKDSVIDYFFNAINNVTKTIDSINTKQHVIVLKTSSVNHDIINSKINDINQEIILLNKLIEQSKKNTASLNNRLLSSTKKNTELNRSIININKTLVIKETELLNLNNTLASLHSDLYLVETTLNFLYVNNMIEHELIKSEAEVLQTAYFIIGSANELKTKNIINKTGGLIGVGKTKKLKNNLNSSNFTRINYSETTSIPINCKKINIISTHPEKAYLLIKDHQLIKNLYITDPVEFWRISKYLIIEKIN